MENTIANVHAQDVQKARDLLQQVISNAGDTWLPSEAIADALTVELIEMAGRHGRSAHVAAYLMGIVSMLRQTPERQH